MSKVGNIGTIFRKECTRFFGDKTMLFTVVLMPGLLIYLMYTLMGDGMASKFSPDSETPTVIFVDNKPPSLAPMFDSLPFPIVEADFNPLALIHDSLSDKHCSLVYVAFPAMFDSLIFASQSQTSIPVPNVQIYYNSSSPNSLNAYNSLSSLLNHWEESIWNGFDINRVDGLQQTPYDVADEDEAIGDIIGSLIPMLILMMLFSGCMAVAPSSIAGEKERGTIATLLVTPLKRSQLAIGKILSLSTFALLSGISSFLGIILSLPRMIRSNEFEISSLHYSFGDYLSLLLIILSTVVVLISVISIISAFAKTVKTATTMITPLMLVVMFVGLLPMMSSSSPNNLLLSIIPFYNSVLSMSGIFSFEAPTTAVALTVVANCTYTFVAVWTLTKMFNSEKIMFSK